MNKEENILTKILFGGKREPGRNPNDPADQPYFHAITGITNQAFADWCEKGGEFVLKELEKKVKEKLEALIAMPMRNIEDVFKLVAAKQNIIDDVLWHGLIVSAFNKEEEKKEALQVRAVKE